MKPGQWEIRNKPDSFKAAKLRSPLALALAGLDEKQALFIPSEGRDIHKVAQSTAYVAHRVSKVMSGRRYRQHIDREEGGVWFYWVAS